MNNAEISLSLNLNGIKTTLTVDIYPESFQQHVEWPLPNSSFSDTASDVLAATIRPTLTAIADRLIEVNHTVSGNLVASYITLHEQNKKGQDK